MQCLLRSNQQNYFPEPKMIWMLSLPSVCSPLSSNPALWHSVKISKKYYVYIESRNPILSLSCRGKRKLTNSSRIHCVLQREAGEEKKWLYPDGRTMNCCLTRMRTPYHSFQLSVLHTFLIALMWRIFFENRSAVYMFNSLDLSTVILKLGKIKPPKNTSHSIHFGRAECTVVS